MLERLHETCDSDVVCTVEFWLPSQSHGLRTVCNSRRTLLAHLCRLVWEDDALITLLYDSHDLLLGVYTFYRWRDSCLDDLGALCQ